MYSLLVTVKNPLDDIADEMHKNFMQKYLNAWPYPPRVQYCVGQKISATLNGILQTCEVVVTDSSLIQVVFEVRPAPLFKALLTEMFLAECSCEMNLQLFVRCHVLG